MPAVNRRDRRFYLHWILANAFSEGMGLSVKLLTVVVVSHMVWSEPTGSVGFLAAMFSVVVSAMFEGALVGYAQAQVLGPRLSRLCRRRWTWATALGAGAACVTVLLLAVEGDSRDYMTPAAESSWALVLLGAAFSGAVLGVVLALPQWQMLRHLVKGAWRWVPANAVAWSIGMGIVFAGISRLARIGGIAGVADGVFIVGGLAGAATGAVHGLVLRRLISEPSAEREAIDSESSPADGSALPHWHS